jgi:dihydrofolate reductase
MRVVRYVVAASLDGYIAGPKGEADWIVNDPDFDFRELFAQFDTFLIGRRTYEFMAKSGRGATPGVRSFVFSGTLRQADHPHVTIVSRDAKETVTALRQKKGKDIWLFGGASLFRSLLGFGLVDRVEVKIIPVLLGSGIPLVEAPGARTKLKLIRHEVSPRTGIVSLVYNVQPD